MQEILALSHVRRIWEPIEETDDLVCFLSQASGSALGMTWCKKSRVTLESTTRSFGALTVSFSNEAMPFVSHNDQEESPAAQLGRKGGEARAKRLSAEERGASSSASPCLALRMARRSDRS